jgi:hypothetical protein
LETGIFGIITGGNYSSSNQPKPDRKNVKFHSSGLIFVLTFNNTVFNFSNFFFFVFSRSQKKMQMVSNISFFAMFVMYFLTAIFGYLTFYGKYLLSVPKYRY